MLFSEVTTGKPVSSELSNGVSLMMQSIGRSYVRYYNDKMKRTGTLWEGRFKSSIVDSEN